ncbi:MAG TPA: PRC-barrel domain-containing protein [Terriglobales bacterium]|nr:PRC-barrel domain-containing protein [Terriglobales bacterium]
MGIAAALATLPKEDEEMAHLGTLRDFRFADQANDVRGSALYGRNDEKLGKIDDVIFDHASGQIRYVVVDTGGWLSSKQFLVMADRIRPRGDKDDEYTTDLTRKQIESLPVYDQADLNDRDRWQTYERDYRRASGFEETGGVLHQAGSTNILVSDDIPAKGPVPTDRTGHPVSGYKSPIRHHGTTGVMDTTPIGVGQNADDSRLTFVPNAIGADRGDIKDMNVEAEAASRRKSNASQGGNRLSGERATDVVHHENDRVRGIHSSDMTVEQTVEGDAIFNSEDLHGRQHDRGNIHDADIPSYKTVGGTETQTSQGRLPNYPDANQGRRWERFEENLRRERPKIVGRCTVCEEFKNRHREDVA